jgi:hypothetical protein
LIVQLNPTMPLLTPKGPALAHFLIDYGEEHHLMWVCVQENTGEIWTWPNTQIRAQANPSFNRPKIPNVPQNPNVMYGTVKDVTTPNASTNGDLDRKC